MGYIAQLEKDINDIWKLEHEVIKPDGILELCRNTYPKVLAMFPECEEFIAVEKESIRDENGEWSKPVNFWSDHQKVSAWRSLVVRKIRERREKLMAELKEAERELNAQKLLLLEKELRVMKGRKHYDKEQVDG